MVAQYLFRPWSFERNCWWLVRDYYRNQLGIELPEYPWCGSLIEQVRTINENLNISNGWVELDEPENNCLVAMGRKGTISHVGVWLADGEKVLHIREGYAGALHPLDTVKRAFNTVKFYRYTG